MTKRDLVESLKDVPDDTQVVMAHWNGDWQEWEEISSLRTEHNPEEKRFMISEIR